MRIVDRAEFATMSDDRRWRYVHQLHARIEDLEEQIEELEEHGDTAWQMDVHAVADEVARRIVTK